jgi:hypothetical protein
MLVLPSGSYIPFSSQTTHLSTLKMEAACSCETLLLINQTTWQHTGSNGNTSELYFGRCPVHILARIQTILDEVPCGFPQSLRENSGIAP